MLVRCTRSPRPYVLLHVAVLVLVRGHKWTNWTGGQIDKLVLPASVA